MNIGLYWKQQKKRVKGYLISPFTKSKMSLGLHRFIWRKKRLNGTERFFILINSSLNTKKNEICKQTKKGTTTTTTTNPPD